MCPLQLNRVCISWAVWNAEWFSFVCWAVAPGTVKDTEFGEPGNVIEGNGALERMRWDLWKSGLRKTRRHWWGRSGSLFSSCVTQYRWLYAEKHEELFSLVLMMITVNTNTAWLWFSVQRLCCKEKKKSLMFSINLGLRKLSLFPSLPFCWLNDWRAISIKPNFQTLHSHDDILNLTWRKFHPKLYSIAS